MSCQNGRTYVNTCIPAPGATAEDATYVIDLTHYTCGGRKICANSAYPVNGDLSYKVLGAPRPVGNGTFQVDILCAGVVRYVPYYGCQPTDCCPCPVSDNIWATVSVPWASETAPVVAAGEVVASPEILRDCCNVTNAVSLVGSFNLTAPVTAGAEGAKRKAA